MFFRGNSLFVSLMDNRTRSYHTKENSEGAAPYVACGVRTVYIAPTEVKC